MMLLPRTSSLRRSAARAAAAAASFRLSAGAGAAASAYGSVAATGPCDGEAELRRNLTSSHTSRVESRKECRGMEPWKGMQMCGILGRNAEVWRRPAWTACRLSTRVGGSQCTRAIVSLWLPS
eukprot:361984-Chlamydomonas_euryale.AAC.2